MSCVSLRSQALLALLLLGGCQALSNPEASLPTIVERQETIGPPAASLPPPPPGAGPVSSGDPPGQGALPGQDGTGTKSDLATRRWPGSAATWACCASR
jgi:hypothetical protein